MKLKAPFSALISCLIGIVILMQTNVILALASNSNNPITAAITSVISNPSPTPQPTSEPSNTPQPTSTPSSEPIATPTPTPNTQGDYQVKSYLVYPADKPIYPEYETAVRNYLAQLQNWYKQKVGATFNMAPLQIVKSQENYLVLRCGLNPSQACLNNPSKLDGNVGAYVNKAIHNGTEQWDAHTATLVFAAGAGGFAGANKNANDTGFAIVGDWVLEPLSGKANSWGIHCKYSNGWQCNEGVAKGTPAHELGHAFGLPHPDGYSGQSIMKWHGDYPTVGFLPHEVNLLKESPFFQTNAVMAPILNTISPNPATWGTVIVLTGSNLTNSTQIYINDYLIPSNFYKPASDDNTSISFTLPVVFIDYQANQTHKLYVKQDNSKSNELNITIAPSVVQQHTPPTTNQALIDPQVNLDTNHSELLVDYSNFNVNVSISKAVVNPTVNFSSTLSTWENTAYAIFNNTLALNTDTTLGTIKVEMPAAIMITGPLNWNGVMNAPRLLSNSGITPIADTGKTAIAQAAIEVGLGDTPLTLNKAVRILIPGQAGKLVGYQRGSTFTKITNNCRADTQTEADNLPLNGDCYISVGNDLVIWTKHFTKFVTYTQTANQSSSNSSSQSGSGNAQAPICGDSKPVSAPKLLSVTASGRNQVTLIWSKALDPVSYYLIAYGTKSNQMEYGNPNVGNKDTTSYVVRGLSNGQTYYFKIRAGNGCMPGEFSNEIAVKVSGDQISGPAAGFKSGVLSTNTQDVGGLSEAKFKPISAANTNRIATSSVNLLNRIVNFFTRLFKN